MSAPAINAATPPSPGAAPGIGAGAPADKGPLGVFEALLAVFSGVPAEPGAVAVAAKAANGKGGAPGVVLADGEAATSDAATVQTPDDAETADTQAADAAAQAACNAALILPTAASPVAVAAVATANGNAAEDAGKSETAWGRDKLPGQPAAPALANRAEKAAADDAVPELPTGETSKGQPSPNASPRATAKLDPPVAPPLNASEPAQPPPPPAAAASGPAPTIPVDAAPAAVVEALVAPQAAAGAKAAEQAAPTAPAAPKDKTQAAKAARNDHGRADVAPGMLAKSGAAAFAPISPVADGAAKGGADDHSALASATAAKPEPADAPSGSADAGAATASTTNASTQVHPGAIPVRGSPQTVANLAAEIAKKLEGRSTRFDLELNPAGLGRVDVRMEIGATGRMTAAMTFDTPQAAAELRARAAELQRHLEQAGFDLSGGLSFDVAGDRGQGRQAQQQQDHDNGQAFRGRAFQEALATAGEAAQAAASGALNLRRSLLAGVDIRI
jgi:flagellar hook-length control protein FliK